MTFILNKCYGGFSLSQFAIDKLGLKSHSYGYDFDNSNSQMVNALASLIAEFGSEKCSGSCAKLRVVEIPDCATDYQIDEYDGFETIIYVVDGKIYRV